MTERYKQQNEQIDKAIYSSINTYNLSTDGTESLAQIIECIVEFLRCLVQPRGNELESGLSKVIFCQFTCDNLHVITGSSSGSLKVWDFQTTKLVDKVRGVADLSVCLSHHGEWVSYNAENDLLSVLEVATVKPVAKFRAKGRIITSCFSRSNELVIIGGHDRTVQVYSMETQERVHSLKGHDGFITVLRCTENDRQLISASDDRTIRIWNLKTGECIHKCGEHKGWISPFAITEDQKKVVTGSIYVLDRAMKVFDIET